MAQTSLEEKGATEDEIVGWHHRLIIDSTGSEQTLGDSEGQGSLACCDPWGCKESDTTEQLNNNNSGTELLGGLDEGWVKGHCRETSTILPFCPARCQPDTLVGIYLNCYLPRSICTLNKRQNFRHPVSWKRIGDPGFSSREGRSHIQLSLLENAAKTEPNSLSVFSRFC